MDETAYRHYVQRLGDEDWRIRDAAIAMLSERSVIGALSDGLSHSHWKVRAWCAELMDHFGDDRCVEPLSRALRDPVARVRSAAVHAISCQRCKGLPLKTDVVAHLVDRALNDPSIRVRRKAA